MQEGISRQEQALQACPMLLLIIGLYMLLHPYAGIIHDARLYTLQALNYLHPELYGNDVFLKHGSQDDYTFFTPLYAGVIALTGVEPAAKLITFASLLALLIAASKLARALASPHLAWLALGLFVVMPGYYGEGQAFSIFERFVTPRMLAEALVLLSVWAWLRDKKAVAAVLLLVALPIHPLMALPGIALLIVMGWGLSQWRTLLALTLVGAICAGLALGGWIPLERWQLDPAWRPVAEWAPHLLVGDWTADDWARVASVLVTLGFAVRRLDTVHRQLAAGTLVTTGLMLSGAWVGGDLLKLALVVQGQAWRCLWLATALAVLLLPRVIARCWPGRPLERCGVILLIGSWLIGHQSLGLFFSIPALLMLLPRGPELPPSTARLLERSIWILLTVLLICIVSVTWADTFGRVRSQPDSNWFEALRALCQDRIAPAAVLVAFWYALKRVRSTLHAGVLITAAAIPAAAFAVPTAKAWSSEYYSQETRAAFSLWRNLIPPGADVLWASRLISEGDPAAVWLLLERPSYFSSIQYNSGLFSREAAIELIRRYRSIPRSLPTEQPLNVIYKGVGLPACSDVPVRYIVTDVRITGAEIVPAPDNAPPPFDRLQLQICP